MLCAGVQLDFKILPAYTERFIARLDDDAFFFSLSLSLSSVHSVLFVRLE